MMHRGGYGRGFRGGGVQGRYHITVGSCIKVCANREIHTQDIESHTFFETCQLKKTCMFFFFSANQSHSHKICFFFTLKL